VALILLNPGMRISIQLDQVEAAWQRHGFQFGTSDQKAALGVQNPAQPAQRQAVVIH
jgi:hypothetical protein